jgi:SOS-response transcriptional repressor LexA
MSMYITKIKIKLNNITKSYQFRDDKQVSQTFIKDPDLDNIKPNSSFFVEIDEDSLIGVGIMPKDLALIDSAIEPINNDLVLAFINGVYTVKRLIIDAKKNFYLAYENDKYEDIEINEDMNFEICGVVVYVLQNV